MNSRLKTNTLYSIASLFSFLFLTISLSSLLVPIPFISKYLYPPFTKALLLHYKRVEIAMQKL